MPPREPREYSGTGTAPSTQNARLRALRRSRMALRRRPVRGTNAQHELPAGVTQLVECLLPKQNVVGSSPIARSTVYRESHVRESPGGIPAGAFVSRMSASHDSAAPHDLDSTTVSSQSAPADVDNSHRPLSMYSRPSVHAKLTAGILRQSRSQRPPGCPNF